VRHKGIDEIKALLKDHTITEDENKRAGEHVQKLTDRTSRDRRLTAAKEKEIMEV
jgi:ribosome recycling factor